jgi:hypothetical protein
MMPAGKFMWPSVNVSPNEFHAGAKVMNSVLIVLIVFLASLFLALTRAASQAFFGLQTLFFRPIILAGRNE